MKVISNNAGGLLRLFIADEITPTNGINLPDLIENIVSKYNFSIPDKPIDNNGGRGRVFQYGKILIKDEYINIPVLKLYNDGIEVDMADTDKSEFVINDLFDFLVNELKFRPPITKPRDFYNSNIVVEFDWSFDSLIKSFGEISKLFNSAIHKNFDKSINVDFSGIVLSADNNLLPKSISKITQVEFTIARRTETDFSKNRYYCTAPLPTNEHIKLMQDFEYILKKTS